MITPKAIQRYRKRNDLTREGLAVKVGVSAQTVWRWEKGETIPEPARRLLQQVIENGAKL